MAKAGDMTVTIRLVPDDDTLKVILKMLDLWQAVNPDSMVALVPHDGKYRYEIINRKMEKQKVKMIACKRCGWDHPAEDKRCPRCGESLAMPGVPQYSFREVAP